MANGQNRITGTINELSPINLLTAYDYETITDGIRILDIDLADIKRIEVITKKSIIDDISEYDVNFLNVFPDIESLYLGTKEWLTTVAPLHCSTSYPEEPGIYDTYLLQYLVQLTYNSAESFLDIEIIAVPWNNIVIDPSGTVSLSHIAQTVIVERVSAYKS